MRKIRLWAVLGAIALVFAGCGGEEVVGAGLDKTGKGKGGGLGSFEEQRKKAGDDANKGTLGEDQKTEDQLKSEAQQQAAKQAAQQQAQQAEQQERQKELEEQVAIEVKVHATGIEPNLIKVVTGGVVKFCNVDTAESDEFGPDGKRKDGNTSDSNKTLGHQLVTDDERYYYTDPNGSTYGFISPYILPGQCWNWKAEDPRQPGAPAQPGIFNIKDEEAPFIGARICVLTQSGQGNCG